ncbi:hypothetical protein ACVWZX_003180 [Deinococcus sp. UYEF24]
MRDDKPKNLRTIRSTRPDTLSFGLTGRRYAEGMSSLPARVRVSRLPLPPTPNVSAQLRRLLPGVGLDTVTQAAAALAGGRVVGAAVLAPDGYQQGIEAGWRGKGLEQALMEAVGQTEPAAGQPGAGLETGLQ